VNGQSVVRPSAPWHKSFAGVGHNRPPTRNISHRALPIPVILTRQVNSEDFKRSGWSGRYSDTILNGGFARSDSMTPSGWSGRSLYSAISGMSGSSVSAGRSGFSRVSQVVPKKETCDRPGHCDLHDRGATPLIPILSPTLVRIRGVPPSRFIPRPFAPFFYRDFQTYVPSAADSHAALTDMLSNVKMVFDTLEICFLELDAWRDYFGSGH